MALYDNDAQTQETDTAANSLPDPTTVAFRTHDLTNTGSAACVWSAASPALPFTENAVAVATISVPNGAVKRVQSDGVTWRVINSPSSVATCPAPMTRAAAIALRTAGTLRTECPYIITDGPTIGTTGNTSATQVEIYALSATEFGLAARVHTTFDNSSWDGLYDIDTGTGTITRLEDNKGNILDDSTGVLIQTQFPWHNANVLRNQVFAPAVLTGWNALPAALVVSDNFISGAQAVVNFTAYVAAVAATFTRNTINRASVVVGAQSGMSFNDNHLDDNFGVSSTGTGLLIISANRISIGSIIISGSSRVNVTNNDLIVPLINFAGTVGIVTVDQCRAVDLRLTRNGAATGAFTVSHLEGGHTCTLTQGAGAGATAFAVNSCTMTNSTVTQNAAAPVTLTQSTIVSSTIVQNGAGQLFISFARINQSTVTMTGTRALYVQYTDVEGESTITQNRTLAAGTAIGDAIADSRISGRSSVTLNGVVDPGVQQTPVQSCDISGGSSVTVADPGTAVTLQNSTVESGSTITIPAGSGLVQRMRFSANATVNTGAFPHDSTIVEGAFTRTFTASNVNRLLNKSFSDVI